MRRQYNAVLCLRKHLKGDFFFRSQKSFNINGKGEKEEIMINYNYSSDNGTTCWIFKKDNCNKSVLVLGLLEDFLKNSLSCENYPWSMLLTTAGPYLVCCSSLGAVFQVVREHLTGICFSLQSIKVKKKMFSFSKVHLLSQSVWEKLWKRSNCAFQF